MTVGEAVDRLAIVVVAVLFAVGIVPFEFAVVVLLGSIALDLDRIRRRVGREDG